MGFGFGMFEVMFFLMFFLVLGVFIVMFIKGISQWNKNNNSPRLTVPVTVVSKRTDVTHHRHANAGRRPDTGGGSQSADALTPHKDHARAQETNAGNDLRSHPRRIQLAQFRKLTQQIKKAVFGHQHYQSGS